MHKRPKKEKEGKNWSSANTKKIYTPIKHSAEFLRQEIQHITVNTVWCRWKIFRAQTHTVTHLIEELYFQGSGTSHTSSNNIPASHLFKHYSEPDSLSGHSLLISLIPHIVMLLLLLFTQQADNPTQQADDPVFSLMLRLIHKQYSLKHSC